MSNRKGQPIVRIALFEAFAIIKFGQFRNHRTVIIIISFQWFRACFNFCSVSMTYFAIVTALFSNFFASGSFP